MATETDLEEPPRWTVLPIVACGGAAAVLAGQFVSAAAAEAIGSGFIAMVSVILVFWKSRGERWFLPFLVAAIFAHGLLWLLTPWPADHEPRREDTLFVTMDFFVTASMAVFMKRVARWASHPNGS